LRESGIVFLSFSLSNQTIIFKIKKMAKSTGKKIAEPKTTAAYSKKNGVRQMSSTENSSKFRPTEDADIETLLLDPADGLSKLFTDVLKDIYWAENHLVKALPKMEKAAGHSELKTAINNHWEQTKKHVERLENIFEILGRSPQARKCDAMEGLTMEAEGMVETTDLGTPARDLGVIMASQKVEHYEIAAYTSLANLANFLELPQISDLLAQTLAEENESDDILAGIADTILSSFDDETSDEANDDATEDDELENE
jgi:ferritin-like metal-binding protein YciE